VIKLLLTAFALGLTSLDITATLVAAGALSAGARVRALVAFGCFCILGTVAFGTALSLIVGPRIEGIDWGMLLPHNPTEDRLAAFVDIFLGVGLLIWGVVRIRRPDSGVVAAHSTWTLVSHIPLVLVLAFALIGENERIVTWVRTLWARIGPWMVRLVTGVVLLVGTFLLLDALWWFATGEFFIPV
jgi:hypothetical protein